MDTENYSSFEEFFNNMCNFTGGCNDQGASDLPGGFQDLNPELFTLIGQLVAMVISGNMPFNVQNAIGNWLTLVGQIIMTYNAQQQYFESGPGRFYDKKYRNVDNPFCNQSNESNSEESSPQNSSSEIEKLKKEVSRLSKELDGLRKKLD